jgi:hypothetical protein
MVGGAAFSEPQGPEPIEKREYRLPAQRQRTVTENLAATEPLAYGVHGVPQRRKRWPRGIQTLKPPAQRGGIGQAIGIFENGRRGFPRTAFYEVAPQRLAAGDQAVVAVGWRERRQEGERPLAEIAKAAPNTNPIMVFVMSLLAPAAVANDGIVQTNRASAKDRFCAGPGPISFEVVLRRRK